MKTHAQNRRSAPAEYRFRHREFPGLWALTPAISLPPAVIVLMVGLCVGTTPTAGAGVSESRDVPVEFGSANNLAWRTDVPAGHSSPVVWEDRVFLAAYDKNQCIVVCL